LVSHNHWRRGVGGLSRFWSVGGIWKKTHYYFIDKALAIREAQVDGRKLICKMGAVIAQQGQAIWFL